MAILFGDSLVENKLNYFSFAGTTQLLIVAFGKTKFVRMSFVCLLMGVELRAWCLPGRYCAAELHSQPRIYIPNHIFHFLNGMVFSHFDSILRFLSLSMYIELATDSVTSKSAKVAATVKYFEQSYSCL